MSAEPRCPACGEPVGGPGTIPCYICGRTFHFTPEKACGAVAPQQIGC